MTIAAVLITVRASLTTPKVIVRDFIALLFYTIQFRLKGRCNKGSRHESAELF